MRQGQIYVNMTGHRKATSIYCARCQRWHDTPRGPNPEACPLDGLDRPKGHSEVTPAPAVPAIIERTRLGTRRPFTPSARLGLGSLGAAMQVKRNA